MTALVASMVPDKITCCVEESLGRFVEMDALQAEASPDHRPSNRGRGRVRFGLCRRRNLHQPRRRHDWGELGRAEDLPDTTKVGKTEVVILKGDIVSYGSNITRESPLPTTNKHHKQQTNTGGSRTSTAAEPYQLRHTLSEKTCTALWVVSLGTALKRPESREAKDGHWFLACAEMTTGRR